MDELTIAAWQEELDAFAGRIDRLEQAVAEQQEAFERRFSASTAFPRIYDFQLPDLIAPIPAFDFVHIAAVPAHPDFAEAQPVLTVEQLGSVEMNSFEYLYDADANADFLAAHQANFTAMAAWIGDLRTVHEQSSAALAQAN